MILCRDYVRLRGIILSKQNVGFHLSLMDYFGFSCLFQEFIFKKHFNKVIMRYHEICSFCYVPPVSLCPICQVLLQQGV